MSYQKTEICIYGVLLSYEKARLAHDIICEQVYQQEISENFTNVLAEWKIEPWIVSTYYETIKMQNYTDTEFWGTIGLSEFFDICNFCERYANKNDLEIAKTSFHNGKKKERYRYFVDIFCFDADSRGDSLRFLSGSNSLFGVYVASNGYAYHDDINYYKEFKDSKIARNFKKYCMPILNKIAVRQDPKIYELWQIW